MNHHALTHSDAFETWRQEIGPTHYAFQHGGATFILLNNVAYLEPRRTQKGERGYIGRIGKEQLQFVRNVLRHVPRNHLVAVSMHIPLVSFEDPLSAPDNTADRHELLALLSGHPHTVSFSGHSHTTEHHYLGRDHRFARAEPHHHHVLTAACGSWWSGPADARGIPVSDSRDGTPKGFHVLSVDGNRYTTRFVPTGCEQASSMRILVPGALKASQPRLTNVSAGVVASHWGQNLVLVDVFDGGPRTRVRLQIEDRNELIAMERVAVPDPFVADLYARHRETCKPWVEAGVSSHMWVADVPGISAGSLRAFTVHVVDEYGRANSMTMI
ncbi:MAG: calcineurin-like phosphoesterase C-terminal domain-containing protein [Hyphomicrobiaceae bacterium]